MSHTSIIQITLCHEPVNESHSLLVGFHKGSVFLLYFSCIVFSLWKRYLAFSGFECKNAFCANIILIWTELAHSPAFLSFLFLSTEMITSTLPSTSTTLVKISTLASTMTTHAGRAPAPLPQARPCPTSVRFLMRETFSGMSNKLHPLSQKHACNLFLTKLLSSSPSSTITHFHILKNPWEARRRILLSHECATWNINFPPGYCLDCRICSTSRCLLSPLAARLLKLTHERGDARDGLELLWASHSTRVRSGISHW